MEATHSLNERDDTKSRLSVLENNVAIVTHNVEKLEHKIDVNYATLHSRISDLRDDLRADFEQKNERVIQKLDDHNRTSSDNNRAIQERISHIERWRWMIMGAALVAGYIIAHVEFKNLF